MRRKLFFLIEKLEISRSERISIILLLTVLMTLAGYYAMMEPGGSYDEEYYAEIEALFYERSRSVEQERDLIMARYEPIAEEPAAEVAAPDTIIDRRDEQRDSPAASERININTASFEELQELPGIGPAYAQRIVDWREENGEFTSKEQLLEIRGIGERRLEAIKPLITL